MLSISDINLKSTGCAYLDVKDHFKFCLRIHDITWAQYQSALKYHIRNNLRTSLVTRRHEGNKAAQAYNRFLNASQGRGTYDSRDYYLHGGTRWNWIDSFASKKPQPLVWAED